MHKFIKETTKKKLVIPNAAMEMGGFDKGEPVEIRVTDAAVIILKDKMTAMDIVHAVDGLQETAMLLITHLAEVCGFCEGCGGDGCPADPKRTVTAIPDDLRKDIGIPTDAKLCAWPGEKPGTAVVGRADYRYDLADVPEWEQEVLRSMNACLAELEELLMSEDPIYG